MNEVSISKIKNVMISKLKFMETLQQNKIRKDFSYYVVSRFLEDLSGTSMNFETAFQSLNEMERLIVLEVIENQYRLGDFELKSLAEELLAKEYGSDWIERGKKMCDKHYQLRFIHQDMKKGRISYERNR